MKLTTTVVAFFAALSWTPTQVEAYGRSPGFIDSTFHHSGNKLRLKLQNLNRKAAQGAYTDEFGSPRAISTNNMQAYSTAVQLGGNENGDGSQGMGSLWRETNGEDEEIYLRSLFQRRLAIDAFLGHRRLKKRLLKSKKSKISKKSKESKTSKNQKKSRKTKKKLPFHGKSARALSTIW